MPFNVIAVPALKLAARATRLVGGQSARDVSRDLRDAAQLMQADVALVSFPKSGRTFLRVMLARLFERLHGVPEASLLEFEDLRQSAPGVPRVHFTHDGDAMRRADELTVNKKAYRNVRVSLLARHPADTAVSRYHHLKHRSSDPRRRALAEQPLEEFVWTEQGGIPAIVAYLNGWSSASSTPRAFQVVRYEDFLTDPATALRSVATFIGLKPDEEQLADAVEHARFANMRAREVEGAYRSARLGSQTPEVEASLKVRQGTAGGYRKTFSDQTVRAIDDYIVDKLDPVFGYHQPVGRAS